MNTAMRWTTTLSTALIPFFNANCTTGTARSIHAEPLPVHHVLVDGKTVPAPRGSLLDLLRSALPANRLALLTGQANPQPLIVIDDVRLPGGTRLLAEIAAHDIQRVTTLRSLDAYVRYGPDARDGAIVVQTLTGR